MTLRLVKVAKELNVGTTTLVDFLVNRGFEIQDKPSAKITDEMYNILLEEFSKDAKRNKKEIKESSEEPTILKETLHKQEEDYDIKPIEIFVDIGDAPEEEIVDILSDISSLYRMMGGNGISFTFKGIKELEEKYTEI